MRAGLPENRVVALLWNKPRLRTNLPHPRSLRMSDHLRGALAQRRIVTPIRAARFYRPNRSLIPMQASAPTSQAQDHRIAQEPSERSPRPFHAYGVAARGHGCLGTISLLKQISHGV